MLKHLFFAYIFPGIEPFYGFKQEEILAGSAYACKGNDLASVKGDL